MMYVTGCVLISVAAVFVTFIIWRIAWFIMYTGWRCLLYMATAVSEGVTGWCILDRVML